MKLALAVAAVAVILAGCSSPATGPVTPLMEDGKYVIHMTGGNMFQPRDATVPAGSKVVFVNDAGTHDVTAENESWSSDDDLGTKLFAGDRYERTFATPGVVQYKCKIHAASPGMKATLTVT